MWDKVCCDGSQSRADINFSVVLFDPQIKTQVAGISKVDPFTAWFAVIGVATLDGRSVLGAISSLQIVAFREQQSCVSKLSHLSRVDEREFLQSRADINFSGALYDPQVLSVTMYY